MGGTIGDFSAVSDAELDVQLHSLAVDLAIADSKIEPTSAARKRLRRFFRGIALNVAGILLAGPTGGLTLFLCVGGVTDMIDVLEEHAAAKKLQIQSRSDLEGYGLLYDRFAAEKARRGPRSTIEPGRRGLRA